MEVDYVFDKTGVIDAKLAVCGWLVHVPSQQRLLQGTLRITRRNVLGQRTNQQRDVAEKKVKL